MRWLRHNAQRFPGNVERIVSIGTSAGGALSALLGASGNHPDYEAELQALGAAATRDDVYAVSAYVDADVVAGNLQRKPDAARSRLDKTRK